MGQNAVSRLLRKTLKRMGLRDQASNPMRYTPRDFRRMFATEAVTGGCPSTSPPASSDTRP